LSAGFACFTSGAGFTAFSPGADSPGAGLPRFTICWSTRLSRSLSSRVSGGASFLPSSGGLTICCSGTGSLRSGGAGGGAGGGGSSTGLAASGSFAATCGGAGLATAFAFGGGGSMMRTGSRRCSGNPGCVTCHV
jgi:hypothetical protein